MATRRMPAIDRETPFGARRAGSIARAAWALSTARMLPQRLRKRIRKSFANGYPGPFDAQADGVSLRLYPAENHCDRTILGRGHLPEEPERELIEPLLFPGMVFVDVGANVGVYSLFISERTGGAARVIALEPHPRTFAKLDVNCRLNGFDNILRVNAGAGAEDAEMVLYSDGGGNIGNASLLKAVAGGKEAVTIRLRPLLDVLREAHVAAVDLLKIDVEGFEDRALMPFLEASPPALWPGHILVETVHRHLWTEDLLAELASRGYAVEAETAENLLLARRG